MVEVDLIRDFDLIMMKHEKLARCFDEIVFFATLNLFHQISRRTHILSTSLPEKGLESGRRLLVVC